MAHERLLPVAIIQESHQVQISDAEAQSMSQIICILCLLRVLRLS